MITNDLKEDIRNLIKSFGADICGFAHNDRFDDAPEGFQPKDIFPDCKSLISFAIALPKGLSKVPSRLIYGHYNTIGKDELDRITFLAAKQLEQKFHCTAIPLPSDTPYEYWDSENMEGRGSLSMKHIAVAAGLGTIGKSSLLLNSIYGNMLTLGAILTDLDLSSDSFAESICLESCRRCIDSCPSNAIENGSVHQKRCRMNTYGKTKRGFETVDCNKCRTVCPMRFGKYTPLT
jgi:epoxyqueuosine reductase QueG